MSENAKSASNTDSSIDNEIYSGSAADRAMRAKNLPQNDRENMEYSWIYLLGEKDAPKKTKIGLTVKENPLRRFKEMTTGNTQLYFFLAYRLPAWYMETLKIEESTWHDFFATPNAAPGPTTGDAVQTQQAKILAADRIRRYFIETPSKNFNNVKCSTRLKRWDGRSSEWFSVTPKHAAAVISEYICAAKPSRYVDYDIGTGSRNKGDYWDKPIAENELIYCYTEEALREGFDGTKHTPSESPIELCNLVLNASQSLPFVEPTPEQKEAQEKDIREHIDNLLSWVDGTENK